MSEPTISKLPWSKAVRNGRQILDPDGNTVAMFRGPNAWRDAAHSLSCVNNLAGLNPEGVRDLIAACEAIMRSSFSGDEARDLFSAIAAVAGSDIGPDIHERCGRLDAALNDLAAALTKVKGQQQ